MTKGVDMLNCILLAVALTNTVAALPGRSIYGTTEPQIDTQSITR